jgi:hypothetical protein
MTTDPYAGLVGSTITLDDITVDLTSMAEHYNGINLYMSDVYYSK